MKQAAKIILGQIRSTIFNTSPAIVNVVKSRSCFAPLMFELGIKVDKVFESK